MNKKVVFCESGYNIFYGAQQSLYNFLINADQDEIDTIALSPGRGLFTEKLEEKSIKVETVEYPQELDKTGGQIRNGGVISKFRTLMGFIKYIKKCISYFRSKNIDLVYCNDIRSILTCGLAAKLSGIPVLWYVRIDKNLGIFNHIGANIANHIVVIADSIKNIFNDKYIFGSKNKFSTVYTGIDLAHVDSVKSDDLLRDELNMESDVRLVGTIASIQPRKGQKDLINSIVKLSKDNSDVLENTKFLIVGDTLSPSEKEYLEEIKQIIKNNNLDDYFYFLGWRKDILNIMKQLDLVVLPSYSEGLPRTVLESLACSCPVISTDVAGTGEIVDHETNGILVPPGDVGSLAEALDHMLSDKTRLRVMGIDARKKIEEKFKMEKYVNNFQNLILETAK
ncbi:glycosyltransferase family 4 protein [Lentibacillus salinarum]|uniref:Glycosyltransferase family 4 protein n=1 Tax=Lentibacillus salinarum TaxID=446820 RepID=A0ABW3ZVS4_9BACI